MMVNFVFKVKRIVTWLFVNRVEILARLDQAFAFLEVASKYTKTKKDDQMVLYMRKMVADVIGGTMDKLPKDQAKALAKEVSRSNEKNLKHVQIEVDEKQAGVSFEKGPIEAGINYDYKTGKPNFDFKIKI